MEKCFYNGIEIYAVDIYKNLSYEEGIRAAGRKGDLKCGDETCHARVIYNYAGNKKDRMAKKSPYFSHYRPDTKCPYSDYFTGLKRRNEEMRRIINEYYSAIKQRYPDYHIKREEKLVINHWTDISIHKQNEIIAIEFFKGYKAPKYMSEMLTLYSAAGIRAIVIAVDALYNEEFEYDFNYAKRTQLNSKTGILIIHDKNGGVKLIKNDPAQYIMRSMSSPLYIFETNIASLDLADNESYHSDFEKAFSEFVANRKKEYDELILRQSEIKLGYGFSRPVNAARLMPSYSKGYGFTTKEQQFYEANKDRFPLSKTEIQTLFDKYCNFYDISERTFIGNLFHAGYKFDQETRENMIALYKDAANNNRGFFIKYDSQFGSLIKSKM